MPRIFPITLRQSTWVIVAVLTFWFMAEAATVLVGRNFHTLIPGRIYRCAQPSPCDLRHYAAKYGIKTVVNLRGCCSNMDWYGDETRATAQADIAQEDITMSAGRLPAPSELKRLVEVLDRAKYPLLIHCRRGVDRTGLTSAIAKLLHDRASVPEARAELSMRYGHFSVGRTVAMLRFFDLYEKWLGETGRQHSADAFRAFAANGYAPGPGRAKFEVERLPDLRAQQPAAIQVRAVNQSAEPWQLRPGTGSGVHLRFQVCNPAGQLVQQGFAGLFLHEVNRGEAVELTLALHGLPSGRYSLTADLHVTADVSFAQLGNEPLMLEMVVP